MRARRGENHGVYGMGSYVGARPSVSEINAANGGKRTAPTANVFTTVAARAGMAAQDHRASVARAAGREQRGEMAVTCPDCGCELDVAVPAHATRCPR